MMERFRHGKLNDNFAERFEARASDCGGSRGGSRAAPPFWPLSGRARQFMLPLDRTFVNPAPAKVLPPASAGEVELF